MSIIKEWISCKDRQPDKPMRALVSTKEGNSFDSDKHNVEIMYWDGKYWRDYDGWLKMNSRVNAWMPLPKVYHPKEEE